MLRQVALHRDCARRLDRSRFLGMFSMRHLVTHVGIARALGWRIGSTADQRERTLLEGAKRVSSCGHARGKLCWVRKADLAPVLHGRWKHTAESQWLVSLPGWRVGGDRDVIRYHDVVGPRY